jgi:hypothetical protein
MTSKPSGSSISFLEDRATQQMQLKTAFASISNTASPARVCYTEVHVLNVPDDGTLLHALSAAIPPTCQAGVVLPSAPVNAVKVQG